jgi:hypothetical protein
LTVLLAGTLAVIGTYAVVLHSTGLFPGRRIVGSMMGQPSVWPVLRLFEYSPAAAAVLLVALSLAVIGFARGRLLPAFLLDFSLAVWLPRILIGFFEWDVEPRYTMGQLPGFLLCAFGAL